MTTPKSNPERARAYRIRQGARRIDACGLEYIHVPSDLLPKGWEPGTYHALAEVLARIDATEQEPPL